MPEQNQQPSSKTNPTPESTEPTVHFETSKIDGSRIPDDGRKPWSLKRVWLGIGVVLLMHAVLLMAPMAIYIVGLLQIVYVVPALILCRRDPGMVQGIIISAGVTLVLNAAYFMIMVMNA